MVGGLSTELTHPGLLWLLLQPGLWPMDLGLCLPPLFQLSRSQEDHCRREDTGSYRQVCASSPRVPKEAQADRGASYLGGGQPQLLTLQNGSPRKLQTHALSQVGKWRPHEHTMSMVTS